MESDDSDSSHDSRKEIDTARNNPPLTKRRAAKHRLIEPLGYIISNFEEAKNNLEEVDQSLSTAEWEFPDLIKNPWEVVNAQDAPLISDLCDAIKAKKMRRTLNKLTKEISTRIHTLKVLKSHLQYSDEEDEDYEPSEDEEDIQLTPIMNEEYDYVKQLHYLKPDGLTDQIRAQYYMYNIFCDDVRSQVTSFTAATLKLFMKPAFRLAASKWGIKYYDEYYVLDPAYHTLKEEKPCNIVSAKQEKCEEVEMCDEPIYDSSSDADSVLDWLAEGDMTAMKEKHKPGFPKMPPLSGKRKRRFDY